MNEKRSISPHEPEEELLSAEDAWEDYFSLRKAMAEKREQITLEIDAATKKLVDNLVAAGVDHTPAESVTLHRKGFHD